METTNWEERRLKAQVRALRHLPPGTWLPDPPHRSDRDLLSELLSKQDEIDALQWFVDNHGDLIARALLWATLSRVRLSLQGLRFARQARQEISGPEEQRFGRLLHLPEGMTSLPELIDTRPTSVSPDLLRSAYKSFRPLWRNYAGISETESDGEEAFALLDSLFQLPEAADPLQWIQETHNHLAAIMTLSYLLGQIHLPDTLWSDEVQKIYHPRRQVRVGEFSIELHQVSLRQTSFTLTLQAGFSDRSLRIPKTLLPALRGIKWQGVESVVDAAGNHYLVKSRLENVAKRLPGRSSHSLQLLCYPTVAPEAKGLTITSNETALLVVGLHPESHRWETLHHVRLGDLTWDMKVAHRGHPQN